MTKQQKDLLLHTLGADGESPGYRNRFATALGCDTWNDIQELVNEGLMAQGRDICGGLTYFHATEAGQKLVGITYKD